MPTSPLPPRPTRSLRPRRENSRGGSRRREGGGGRRGKCGCSAGAAGAGPSSAGWARRPRSVRSRGRRTRCSRSSARRRARRARRGPAGDGGIRDRTGGSARRCGRRRCRGGRWGWRTHTAGRPRHSWEGDTIADFDGSDNERFGWWVLLAGLFGSLVLVATIWGSLDRRPPGGDGANHPERAVHCQRILSEAGRDRFRESVEMSAFYPPVVPCAAGLLYRVFPGTPLVSQSVMLAFLGAGLLALFLLGRRLFDAPSGLAGARGFGPPPPLGGFFPPLPPPPGDGGP